MKWPQVRMGKWWRPAILVVLAGVIMVGVLSFQLGALAPRLSPAETQTLTTSQQYAQILHNPLNAPYRTLVWASLHLPLVPLLWQARLPSVLLGTISLGLALYILQRWYGRRSAVFGFLIFATSAWILHVARFAGPEITDVLAILAVLAVQINLRDHEESKAAWFVWLATLSLLLFTPGIIWLLILAIAWQWYPIAKAWQGLGLWQRIISVVTPLAALGFIAQASLTTPWKLLLLTWLGVPQLLPLHILRNLPQDLLTTISFIGWHAPSLPALWLGDLPLLNGFVLTMLAAGIAFYARHWQAARSQLLASYVLLGLLLASLGIVSIGVLVPLLYLIAVAGIAYLLHFWFRVFPRNPLARSFGISLVTVLVGLSCYFGLLQYFVAWPHNPAVQQVYRITH